MFLTHLMVGIPFQVNCFIDILGVRAGRNLGNHVVQMIHITSEKNKAHRGPLGQLGAEERQEPMTPSFRSGH